MSCKNKQKNWKGISIHISLRTLSFKLPMHLYLKLASCTEHMFGSSILIQFDNIHLLVELFQKLMLIKLYSWYYWKLIFLLYISLFFKFYFIFKLYIIVLVLPIFPFFNSTFRKLRSWHPVPSLHGK